MTRSDLQGFALAAVMLTLMIAPACGKAWITEFFPPPSKAERAAYATWTAKAVTTLTARGDADALFTAASLAGTDTGLMPRRTPAALRHRLALLQQAAALAPEAPEIARAGLSVCAQLSGCDIRAWTERLDAAGPDDASRLRPALRAAWQRHDDAAVTTILQDMAQAGHFNDDLLATATRLARGLAYVPDAMPPQVWLGSRPESASPADPRLSLDARTVHEAVAWFLAQGMTISNYGSLLQACRPDRAEFAQRRADCTSIGVLLKRADVEGAARMGQYLTTETSIDAGVIPPGVPPSPSCRAASAPMPNPDRSFLANITTAARQFQATVRAGSVLGGLRLICGALAAARQPAPR